MRQFSLSGQQRQSRFLVGRDRSGHWVVADARGLSGGIFADRAAAVHFALEESNFDPANVSAAPEGSILSIDVLFAKRAETR